MSWIKTSPHPMVAVKYTLRFSIKFPAHSKSPSALLCFLFAVLLPRPRLWILRWFKVFSVFSRPQGPTARKIQLFTLGLNATSVHVSVLFIQILLNNRRKQKPYLVSVRNSHSTILLSFIVRAHPMHWVHSIGQKLQHT